MSAKCYLDLTVKVNEVLKQINSETDQLLAKALNNTATESDKQELRALNSLSNDLTIRYQQFINTIMECS